MSILKRVIVALLIASFIGTSYVYQATAQQTTGANPGGVQPISWGGIEGAVAGSPAGCTTSETQYTIQIDEGQNACGTTYIEIFLDTKPDVKLYVRYGQKVVFENGEVIADYKDESGNAYKSVTLAPPYESGTYYIALVNCAPAPSNFLIRFAFYIVDYFGPYIREVSMKGKKLVVIGCRFLPDSVIMINGVEQRTSYMDDQEMPALMAKKAGRGISPGETVYIQVKNSSGMMSQAYAFTKGAE